MVNIRQNICPSNKWHIKCPNVMNPEFVVIHNTANDASANNEILYMNRNNNYVSYHFAVDDTEVVQGLPLDRNGWHAGDGANGRGNRKGIAIEICYSLSGGARFDQAERNAAWLTAKLLKERGWGIDRVKKHQDFMKKYCPHRTLDYGWQRFLDIIQAELNTMNQLIFVWSKMDNPREMIAKGDINIYEIPSLKVVGTIANGKATPFVQKTVLNGITYLRSAWSFEHNKNNGVKFADLTEKPIPKPVVELTSPTPQPSEPVQSSETGKPQESENTPQTGDENAPSEFLDNSHTSQTQETNIEVKPSQPNDRKAGEKKQKLPTETIEDLIEKGENLMENYKDIAEEASSDFDFSDKTKKIVYLIGDTIILGGVITPMLVATINAPDVVSFSTALSQLLVTIGTGLLFTFKLLKKKS